MKDFHQMKNKAKLFGIYLPVFLTAVIATVAMRTVALFSHFDFTTGYFTEKLLISISNYTLAAAVLLFFTYIFTARRDIRLIADFTSPATYIPTGIVGSALIFMAFYLFRFAGELLEYIEYLIGFEIDNIKTKVIIQANNLNNTVNKDFYLFLLLFL